MLGWNFYIFVDESFMQLRAYCFLSTETNSYKMGTEYLILMVIDIIVTIADLVLTKANVKNLSKYGMNITKNGGIPLHPMDNYPTGTLHPIMILRPMNTSSNTFVQ
jgi:hypothetical protein